MEDDGMSDLEHDAYVYTGQRIARNGHVLGHGQGMTLRDWFAGEAPEAPVWWMIEGCPQPPPGWSDGYGATKWSELTIDWRVNRIALWRWKYADAMIAARKGGEQ